MRKIDLDRFDFQILQQLQQDARATHQKLAQNIPLSASQIGRRIQRMEQDEVIQGYQVALNPEHVGLTVMAFANVSLERHNEAALLDFAQSIHALPEVLECYAAAGEADYLLRIVVPDLPSLSAFVMNKLMQLSLVRSVKSTIVLNAIKQTMKLPLASLP